MATEPEAAPPPGAPPDEERQVGDVGHQIARRRPDGPRIDEVGDPVPFEKNPHLPHQ
jgi:hypothetical protein